jgi:tetratricopeptide (TPR) repeat protein
MKRTERHRLKENEVALSFGRARETWERNQRQITAGLVAVVVIVAAVAGYFYWRGRRDTQSRAMLADAMVVAQAQVVPPAPPPSPDGKATPANSPAPPPPGSYPTERAKLEAALPRFLATANAYPSTQAGIAARYHAAGTLVALGRASEAIQRYQEVVDRAGETLYGSMARLGKADAEAVAKQYDTAIAAYKELATRKDQALPVDGILMQLGRAYQMAGKTSDAMKTFQRIVDEYPQSVYSSVAKKELDNAKVAGAGDS